MKNIIIEGTERKDQLMLFRSRMWDNLHLSFRGSLKWLMEAVSSDVDTVFWVFYSVKLYNKIYPDLSYRVDWELETSYVLVNKRR